MVIYGIQGQTLIAIQEHKKGYYIGDSTILYNLKQLRLNTFRNMIEAGISFHNTPRYIIDHNTQNYNLIVNNRFIYTNSMRILYLDQTYNSYTSSGRIKVDILLLSHNPGVKIIDLKKDFEFNQIVFDCSNAPWMIEHWKSDCEKQQIKYYDINSSGAMIIDI